MNAAETGERVDLARALGSTTTAMYLYDVMPGRSSCPYHYEYEEERLLVVAGTVVVLTPDGERTLKRGDILRFPPGPGGAHKIMNRSATAARTLVFSSSRVPAVSVYPDSDKIAVFLGDDADELVFSRGSAVPYSQGEEEWERKAREV